MKKLSSIGAVIMILLSVGRGSQSIFQSSNFNPAGKHYLLDQAISLLLKYGYPMLFAMAIVEGPVIAVLAGFLCSQSLMNPVLVFPLIILGDIVGDSTCYCLGRWGVPKILKGVILRFAPGKEKIARVRAYFNTHPVTSISLSKITLGVGPAGIYIAGNARVPYRKFIGICLLTSTAQYLIYLGIGMLFGNAYLSINHYLNGLAAGFLMAALALLLVFFIQSTIKKI